jgi:hypothetical protein
MTQNDTCRKCGVTFPTRPSIVDYGLGGSIFFYWHQIPPRVQCPNCRHTFRSAGIRYFGRLAPAEFRGAIVLAAMLVAIVVAVIFLSQ